MAPRLAGKRPTRAALRDAEEAAVELRHSPRRCCPQSPPNITNGAVAAAGGSSIGSGPTAHSHRQLHACGPRNDDDDDDDDDDELMLTQREGESERGRMTMQPGGAARVHGPPPVFKEARHPPDNLAAEPNGRWMMVPGDKEGGPPVVWRCHRPRAEHEFRCRLHDEELSNGDERPAAP